MKRFFVLFIISFTLFSSCAYYNTFFNAKKLFRQAQEMSLQNGRPASGAMTNYTKTIKKCGFLIEEYKNSKWVDDALYLLARCYYYKQNSYIQAINSFEELITKFPESEFVPDAQIYLAKCYYELKKEDQAKSRLKEIIADNGMKSNHSKASLLLAEYYLHEENFIQAEIALQKIIDSYQDSDEFDQAYLLLGKNYHNSEKYEKSNQILQALIKERIDKQIKLEARFLIAKNYLKLQDYDTAIEYSKELIEDQYNSDKRALTKLVLARSYAANEEFEKAEDLFRTIIHENNRTVISAEAYYFLGEMFFKQTKNYQQAIESYNKVKSEFNKSIYVEDSVTKSAIASQILQYKNADSDMDLSLLVEQQFKLAEYYIQELNYPDSAIFIYDTIIHTKDRLNTAIDSLQITTDAIRDSLNDILPAAYHDVDSVHVLMKFVQNDTTMTDSLQNIAMNKTNRFRDYMVEIFNLQNKLYEFDNEYVPFAYFTKIWVNHILLKDEEQATILYSDLWQLFPENKYRYAAKQLLDGEEVEFVTPEEKESELRYQSVIDNFELNPRESISVLEEFSDDIGNPYYQKSLYTIGYINYFVLGDSTAAKPFFDELIEVKDYEEDLLVRLASFYDGENFKHADSLTLIEKINAETEKKESEEKNPQEDEQTGQDKNTDE